MNRLVALMMRLMKKRTCKDVVSVLQDYSDGTPDPKQAAMTERHFEGCQDCTAFARTYRRRLSSRARSHAIRFQTRYENRSDAQSENALRRGGRLEHPARRCAVVQQGPGHSRTASWVREHRGHMLAHSSNRSSPCDRAYRRNHE